MGSGWPSRIHRAQRLWLMLFIFCLSSVFSPHVRASKKEEAINTAPDSNTAGLINTEVVPEGAYQADFTTGNLWYGITPYANAFVNVYATAATLIGTPAIGLGGKVRYCESIKVSCSLTAFAASGLKLGGPRKRIFSGLLQHTLAFDFDTFGRVIWGLGGGIYAERDSVVSATGYSDRLGAWMNFFYDLPMSTEWSFGAGFSPSIKTIHQYFIDDSLVVNRLGFIGGKFIHIRGQYSSRDWHLSGGAGLLSLGDNWSLWPVVEVVWRIPESLFISEEASHEEE